MYRIILFSLLNLLIGLAPVMAQKEERILNYDVEIEISPDRSITVTEDIEVVVQGNRIKRGITRSLPKSRNFQGRKQYMSYDILSVQKDGKREPYHTKSENGNLTLYIGEEDVLLRPGTYLYTIRYRVPNQIARFDTYDELYWNVIGQAWQFPIERASCLLSLPGEAGLVQQSCYTGSYGQTEQACVFSEPEGDAEVDLMLKTIRPLARYEGLTMGVGFEKGFIDPPSAWERYGIAGILGSALLILLIYFVTTWYKYGVDPPRPTPYPLYESPEGISPAGISYISKEVYSSKKGLTASLIHLAVQGFLHIEQIDKKGFLSKSKKFRLSKKEGEGETAKEEKELYQQLFRTKDSQLIDGQHNKDLEKAQKKHRSSVHTQWKSFVTAGYNRKFWTFPILFSIGAWILSAYLFTRQGGDLEHLIGIGVGLVFVTVFSIPMISAIRGGAPRTQQVVWSLGFIFVLGMVSLLNISLFSDLTNYLTNTYESMGWGLPALIVFIALALIGNIVYGFLIKKPSPEKQKLQSEIEGFKMYLEMAEKDRLQLLNPPERTPEHFEAMLPYAIALGVENTWAEGFQGILEQASYEPRWSNSPYVYSHGGFYNSFSSSMASSAATPSSSGSGGGGFSGGGGGGGGGGGW
jgi:uncharacterized membrane protein YgcG